jgi:hypothetical protein
VKVRGEKSAANGNEKSGRVPSWQNSRKNFVLCFEIQNAKRKPHKPVSSYRWEACCEKSVESLPKRSAEKVRCNLL